MFQTQSHVCHSRSLGLVLRESVACVLLGAIETRELDETFVFAHCCLLFITIHARNGIGGDTKTVACRSYGC